MATKQPFKDSREITRHLADRGLLTGESDLDVEEWSYDVKVTV